ncbi:segregation/condensation protein A [Iodidimonas gelatinilytica]|uniref:Segregation and condensation protein A n=2 Tax=Iodidimonas gelatinilytica TaxID=1236966 RepID=A0A5A7MU04_9PROT|nr:ScpA family protein [Iodidimonas gelatinilytica]GEQ98783.1 segregation/condensation protein A [Iodidimonas gelatinilytica]
MTAQPDEGQQHNLDGFDGPSDAARARQNSAVSPDALILDVDGFEGPLDVLLMLARSQKVDLEKISIRALVEQYLAFISEARKLRLELAADYLVMAAWLAYLKSRLLLPRQDDAEEPSAEELALRLQVRLQRLEAMREAGAALMARDRLGRDVFTHGAPEGLAVDYHAVYDTSLYDLLRAYADIRVRGSVTSMHIAKRPVYALDEAVRRLNDLVGGAFNWTQLRDFLPTHLDDPRMRRSALASMFVASLELARTGRADIRQMVAYGPLYVRRRDDAGYDSMESDNDER